MWPTRDDGDAGAASGSVPWKPARQTWLAWLSAGLAALLVIVSAFVKTMIPLRWLAVASNVGFIVYGLLLPGAADGGCCTRCCCR
jgi:hypothetical protein